MDVIIILSSVYGFLLFLVIQMVLFRVRSREEAPLLVIHAWLISVTAVCIVDAMIADSFLFLGTSLLTYIAVSAFYLFVIFSGFESSITLQLLSRIAEADERGIGRRELFDEFTVKSVVASRLLRLQASGEVVKRGNRYAHSKKTSVFLSRQILYSVFLKMFPVT